ncbi:MAG TPA: hypothetical protein VGY55_06195 [Pirellulales bacterium]|jgi:hypothetical protein|nr:hypothetical protein [Pirellulales bacterium]
MIHWIGIALFLIAVTGIGAVAERWLRSGPDRDPMDLSLGWAYLLGAAIVGIALHVPLAIDGRITHLSFLIVAEAGLAAWCWLGIGWWRRRRRPRLFAWVRDLPLAGKIALGIALAPAVLHSARSELTGYDARSIYALKARMLYDSGTVRNEDFQDVTRVNFNPTYPLLLPLLEAEMDWAEQTYEAPGLKFLFVGFALAAASIYAGAAKRFDSPGFVAVSALLFLQTPILLCCFEGAGFSGSADLPLAAFLFGGVLELTRWLAWPSWRGAASAGVLLGAAALTKSEGMLWIAVCGGSLAIVLLVRSRSFWPRAATILPVVAIVGGAIALGTEAHRGMPNSPYYPSYAAALDWKWLKQLADRPWPVLIYASEEFFRVRFWNLIWPCLFAALCLLRRGRLPAHVWLWRLTAGGMAAAYLAVLVVTPLHLRYQLLTSTTRLMLHLYPLAVLIMSEQLAASGWSRQLTDIFRTEPALERPAPIVPMALDRTETRPARAA